MYRESEFPGSIWAGADSDICEDFITRRTSTKRKTSKKEKKSPTRCEVAFKAPSMAMPVDKDDVGRGTNDKQHLHTTGTFAYAWRGNPPF